MKECNGEIYKTEGNYENIIKIGSEFNNKYQMLREILGKLSQFGFLRNLYTKISYNE